jgi:hypothetical protein
MREWQYSSTFIDLGTRWRLVVSFTPQPLYLQGKSAFYLLDRRLLDAVEKRKVLPLPGMELGLSSP